MGIALGVKAIAAEDFEKFDPDWRYDLVEGGLRPMPPLPGAEHGAITMSLSARLAVYVEDRGMGRGFAAETRFVIEHDPDTALAPDWAFVARERLPDPLPKGFLHLAPDIVLEVRSPSDSPREVQEKVGRWLGAGARIVWDLDPGARVLTVHRPGQEPRRLGADEELSGEDVLPGFHLPLGQVLPR